MGLTTYLYTGYNPFTKYQKDIPVLITRFYESILFFKRMTGNLLRWGSLKGGKKQVSWMLRFFFACFLLRKISEVKWHAIPFTQIIYKFPEVFCDLDRAFCFLINQMICWFQFRKRVIWTLWKVSYPSIFRNDIIQAATSDAKNGIVSGAPQQWMAGPGSTWKKDLQSTAFFWCFLLVISHEKTQRACHGCDLFASKNDTKAHLRLPDSKSHLSWVWGDNVLLDLR